MPRKKSNIEKSTRHAWQLSASRGATSFGATNIVKYGNFKARFKVQGQIHQIGSLLPVPEQDPQF